jgi:hypothetical protein
MKDKTLLIKLFVVSIVFTFSACQKSVADSVEISPAPHISTNQTSNAPVPDSPIRKIDFKNFTYPALEWYGAFTFKNGEKPYVHGKEAGIYLDNIEYADLTGDEQEEAILTMGIQTGGSMIPSLIYIYTLKNGKPKFLWGFVTGDRAEGGLKEIYVENGELIVELFGDDKFENGQWEFNLPKNERGLACPTAVTKFRFKWNGKNFEISEKPELFNYDDCKPDNS